MIRNPRQLHLMRLGLSPIPANGGGGGSTTSNSVSTPWTGQQPYLSSVFGNAANTYNQYASNPSSSVAGFTPMQQQAMQNTQNVASDIGKADSASRAILRHTDAGLVIAFPGTDNAACLMSDFDIEPFDVAGIGSVYKGFWDAWDAISLPVLAAAAGQPVILVGHSLGGAMAILAAAYMAVGGNPPSAVYAFEPPRVGDDMGIRTALASVPLWLTRNGNDLVTDLPPAGHHPAMLTPIGMPAYPFPNLTDHQIARVIAALPTS